MGHLNRTAHNAASLVDFIHGQQRAVQLGDAVRGEISRDIFDEPELDGICGESRAGAERAQDERRSAR
jgi:hypothetical protein